MSSQQLRDLLHDAADDLAPADLGARVHRGVRQARRRRAAAGAAVVAAAVAAGSFALVRPTGTRAGSVPAATGATPSVAPSAIAPVPAIPVVSQPVSAVGQPALYVYFRVTPVPHQAAQLRLVVVTAHGDRVISGVDEGNAMDLSPDGRSLAITGAREDARWQLPVRIVDLRTGAERTLTRTSTNAQPSWSPDGRYVAYMGELGGGIVDARTGALMPSRSLTFAAGPLSWSPDGKSLAGNMDGQHGHIGVEVTKVDLSPGTDTGRTIYLTSLPGTFSLLSTQAWSPDGSQLYVYDLAAQKPNEQNEVISAADGHVVSRNPLSPWAPWQDVSTLKAEQAALPADHREVAYRP